MSEQEKKKDIFDKIMDWGIMKPFRPLYKKYKEQLLYLFFGFLTTVVSFIAAGVFKYVFEQGGMGKGLVTLLSTGISWCIAVVFAYVTNRVWVFENKAHGREGVTKEALSFFAGRGFTLVVEELIMWLGYSVIGINYWVTKVFANIVIIILNYVISKLIVFKKPAEEK